jgi:hypothetical protein
MVLKPSSVRKTSHTQALKRFRHEFLLGEFYPPDDRIGTTRLWLPIASRRADPTDIVTIMGASVSTYSGHLQSLGITVDWKYQTEAKLCCFDKASRADHHMAIVVAHYLMRSPQTKPNLLRSVVEKKGSNKFARRRLAH